MWVTPNFRAADLIELYVFTCLVITFSILILVPLTYGATYGATYGVGVRRSPMVLAVGLARETANNLLPIAKGEKVAFFLAVFKLNRAD